MTKIRTALILFLLLLVTNFAQAQATTQNNPSFKLEEATIASIHTAFKNGQLTCKQLVGAYIDRIKKYNLSVDDKAPINAIAVINPNVFEQAKKLDAAFQRGRMGPLHCVPVLLKDNIDTYDMTTTSGSLSMLGNQPIEDAFLAEKLRNAGAIFLGKGTMDEFSSGVAGISSGHGRVGNVYNTAKNSGGSSSGPATAVSANFALIGIGSDNSGSIRIPAAFNGVVGLRTSTGLISQTGIFPRGNLDGVAGPITRNVEDLARVLDVIAKSDSADPKTAGVPRARSYKSYLNRKGMQNKRIGVIQSVAKKNSFRGMPEDTHDLFERTLNNFERMGAKIIPDIHLPFFDLNRQFNQAGEREDINRYLASYPSVRKNYADICRSHRAFMLGKTDDCLNFVARLSRKNSDNYNKALKMFRKNKEYVEKIMDHYNLDALIIPVSSTGSATYDTRAVMNELVASNSGLPSITMNIGYTHQGAMPIGIEFIGRQYAEGDLIEMAYAYEKQTRPRKLPVMPWANQALVGVDIPTYNNLLTQIGYETYKNVLSKTTPQEAAKVLTPELFRRIVRKNIQELGSAG